MIKLENLNKYYRTKNGRHYVFKDVNIELPTDRSIAVLGPNGAGKSTLIRMMGGADMPSSGRIISDKNISWPLGLKGGLQGSMTGRENVRFVARIHGYKDTKQIEQQVADFAEIGKYFDEPVKTYSNGMRSKITFGLTMGFDFNFDVLLIDELSAVGDAAFKQKSTALLKEKYETTKIIMVHHSIAELKKFCDSGVVVKNQNLVFHENLNAAIADYRKTYVN
ncbi:ABC transporter ATP-binding protein [Thalassotalea sp. PS06]|uniref:ABC transporter ATP-binding protein n=1 Tax=Thalassotalea sp. PS06 TaxID=2594005 RepID=UPI001163F74B|nr:ABC transporter ATP-binding protein [Thalassotalea sp. PS06]QDP01951.1 ABC transporter ATP-binding protein [Thalassotalea sp. PS06]